MSPSELFNLTASFATLSVIVAAVMLGYRFLRRWEYAQERSFANSEKSAPRNTQITLNQDQPTPGGYDFVQVDDKFKPLFLDAMNGFSDYAKLKGYSVELSTDTSLSGKVGIRFSIMESGVTVSTKTVRSDIEEYIQKFRDTDDLSDMPMAQNAVEHHQLVSALSTRFAHMQSQLRIRNIEYNFMQGLITTLQNGGLTGIGHQPTHNFNFTLTNDGGNQMRDNYSATNSQNIAQGKGASATTTGSTIQIGNNAKEVIERVDALKRFVIDAEAADIPEDTKKNVVRYITNAYEELENEKNPDPDIVGKALEKANNALSALDSGAGLIEKLLPILGMFGLNLLG